MKGGYSYSKNRDNISNNYDYSSRVANDSKMSKKKKRWIIIALVAVVIITAVVVIAVMTK
jgi:hypothetical protein